MTVNPDPEPSPIRVAIVEDERRFREHLAALVAGARGFRVTGAYATAEHAVRHVPVEKPDVLLLDLELPEMSGLECINYLSAKCPQMRIIVLTVHSDQQRVFDALAAGATGYLHKPVAEPSEILRAIADIHKGGAPMSSHVARLVVRTFQHRHDQSRVREKLTVRETIVLELLSQGLSNCEIAGQLHISERTVGSHLHNIYEKLHAHTRAGAVAKFLRR